MPRTARSCRATRLHRSFVRYWRTTRRDAARYHRDLRLYGFAVLG